MQRRDLKSDIILNEGQVSSKFSFHYFNDYVRIQNEYFISLLNLRKISLWVDHSEYRKTKNVLDYKDAW